MILSNINSFVSFMQSKGLSILIKEQGRLVVMDLLNVSAGLDNFFWGKVMIYLCLAAGIYFSVLMKFPQVRLFKDMVRLLFKGNKSSEEGISPFQGFAMALGGRVGTGNITGVASAIFFGGPGAVFWMWAIAFLGAGSAYIEAALAQVWKQEVLVSIVVGQRTTLKKGWVVEN